MHSDADNIIRAENRAQGLRIKRNNLVAASLSGLILVLLSIKFVPPSRAGFLLGLLVGFVYANGFEYCLHRFLLHSGRGIFANQHMVHHTTLKSPEAARYVNFSSNPWGVVALFAANALPFFILEWMFKNGWVAGAFVSFATWRLRRFTGGAIWADGCRLGLRPRHGTICGIMQTIADVTTYFCPCLIG